MTRKIAILEPYEALRESLNLILEDYDLFHANDPGSVIELLGLMDNLDLLILDVDFVPDSLDLLKLIRTKYAPELRILLLSKHFTLEYQESVIRTGTDFFFKEKPFGKDLLERIQILLGECPPKPVNTVVRISPSGEIDIQK